MDLYDAPLYLSRELYHYSFSIRKEREKADKEKLKQQQEAEKKKAKQKADQDQAKRSTNKLLDKMLSPAAQAAKARELHTKSQDDESKSENKTNDLSNPHVDLEDLIDLIEDGG